MQKTMTDALMDRLKKACADMCRKDTCRMECEAHGAKIGFCEAVWDVTRRGE